MHTMLMQAIAAERAADMRAEASRARQARGARGHGRAGRGRRALAPGGRSADVSGSERVGRGQERGAEEHAVLQ